MMNMFRKYIDTITPLKEYCFHLFKEKRMVALASESGVKVVQFAELRKELFHPVDPTNAATDERLVQLAK